jgi:sucrose phosphorylase
MAQLRISGSLRARIQEHLAFLYGTELVRDIWVELETILSAFHQRNPDLVAKDGSTQLTEQDAILITYGDQFQSPGVAPLRVLRQVLVETLDCPVSGVHILPFFPYSSDDGFSIIDYTQVKPQFGEWTDVEALGQEFRLMFDAVINHISQDSAWFQGFLRGDPEYTDWFIVFEPDNPTDWIPQVVRPRPWPLLTRVQTDAGEKLVWTTFSEDQIDLNYAHPPVLLRVLEILLLYVERGAQLIRLDAIAYLWKTPGTPCIHLEETHRVVKLMRCVLDAVAPGTILITETNVPHEQNISYFGQPIAETGRTDEAQMVYQFPLPPLVMHSLLTGDARALSEWAANLEVPPGATFFNFTASHDGVGVMPARGLLSEAEIQNLVDTTLAHGGRVSYKTNADGSRSVYELNISYFDALSVPAGGEPLETQVARFIASQAIMLALAGVPGIYVHSLLGSRSWQEGVAQTGQNRTINREKLDLTTIEQDFTDPASLRSLVFAAYRRLLNARQANRAFHPNSKQQVLQLNDRVFALHRTSHDSNSQVLCLHNVSDQQQKLRISRTEQDLPPGEWRELLTGESLRADQEHITLTVPPYAVWWLSIRDSA